MANNIVRFYWVVNDNHDGTETEETFRTKEAALAYYRGLGSVPYKKVVAVYDDKDVEICKAFT